MSYSPFKLEKSTDGGATWVEIGDISQGTYSFQASGIVDGQSTQFRIRAYSGANYSEYSAIETLSCQWIPAPPTTLSLACGV